MFHILENSFLFHVNLIDVHEEDNAFLIGRVLIFEGRLKGIWGRCTNNMNMGVNGLRGALIMVGNMHRFNTFMQLRSRQRVLRSY